MDLCENVPFLYVLRYATIFISIMRFLIPIVLIIKIAFDLYKNMLNTDDKDLKEKVTQRLLACVFIFLVPTLVDLFLVLIQNVSNMSIDYDECKANASSIADIKLLEEKAYGLKEKQEEDFAESLEKGVEAQKRKQKETSENAKKLAESTQNATSEDSKVAIQNGTPIDLTDSELTKIAKICQKEQGSSNPKGAAAEAELIVNKYNLSGYEGSLYKYVFESDYGNWWHCVKKGNCDDTDLKDEIKEAVRKVIVEGVRNMPGYINEHDCYDCNKSTCSNGNRGDICSLLTNGTTYKTMSSIKNRSNYVQGETKVYTKYKQDDKVKYWVFWSFPSDKSDPFGYTERAKEKFDKMNIE